MRNQRDMNQATLNIATEFIPSPNMLLAISATWLSLWIIAFFIKPVANWNMTLGH